MHGGFIGCVYKWFFETKTERIVLDKKVIRAVRLIETLFKYLRLFYELAFNGF